MAYLSDSKKLNIIGIIHGAKGSTWEEADKATDKVLQALRYEEMCITLNGLQSVMQTVINNKYIQKNSIEMDAQHYMVMAQLQLKQMKDNSSVS